MPPAVPNARKRESKFLLFLLAVLCFSGGIYCGRYFSRSAFASSNPVTTHSLLRTAEFQRSIESSASSVVKADAEAIKEQPVKLTKTAKSEGRTANSLRREQSNLFSPYGGIQKYLEGQTKLFSDSFHADEEAYLQLGNDLDRNGHLFISLFVSLDCSSSIQTMRTLFSNKDSGCTPDSAHYGLALFMNEWRTKDGLLYLEYGNKGSGCNKINTGYKLDCGKWHHIAVHTNSKGIEVFVDGIRVSRTSLNAFSVREIQPNNGFVFGRYDASDYPLYGNMSRIAFSYSAQELDDEGVQATVMRLMDTKDYKLAKGLVAYFPLTSNHRALDKTVPLLDVVGGRKGEYKVALPAGAEVLEQVRKINADLGTMRDKGAVKTSSQSDDEARERRQVIKDAMSFVWSNYRRYAWGRDELKPVSKSGQDNWGGMGRTSFLLAAFSDSI